METLQLLAIAVILLLYMIMKWSNSKLKIPGPTPLPVIGNLHQLDSRRPHITLTKWIKDYGDIYAIKLMNVNTVVLNSSEAIHEALVTKGTAFAGRPPMFRLYYGAHQQLNIAFQTYTPKLQQLRTVGHKAIKSYAVGMERLENIMMEEIREMLDEWSSHKGQPFDPKHSLHATVCNIMTTIVLGEQFKTNDKEVMQVLTFDRLLSEAFNPVDGAELDMFPWLRYFGNKTFKKIQLGVKERDDFINKQFKHIKETLDPNNVRGIFDALFLSQQEELNQNQGRTTSAGKLSDFDIKVVISDLIVAGTATTSTALSIIVLLMLNYPEVQKKVQREINQIIGKDRLPNLDDRRSMPYTEAVIYEVLRYSSHVPNALPHYTMEDTSVGGYEIPKDTQVLINTWNVQHDERYYDDPWVFKPERFLDEDGNLVPVDHPARKKIYLFGAGRRICIGENLGKSRLFLFVAAMLQRFCIQPVEGEPIPSSDPRNYLLGIILYPDTYRAVMKERI